MISPKTASIYTQGLKRTPPAKTSGVELTESEILDRDQKLAAYRANLKRPIAGKHIRALQNLKAIQVASEGAKTAAEGAQAAAKEGTAASKDLLREMREMKDRIADIQLELMVGREETEQRDFQTDEQHLKEVGRRMALMAQSRKELKQSMSKAARAKKAEQRQKAKKERQRMAREERAQIAEANKKAKPKPNQQRRGKRKASASPSSDKSSGEGGGVTPIQAADDTGCVERECQHCRRTLPGSRKAERNPHPNSISDADWYAWQTRKDTFAETKALQQPDLTFAEWMKERDVCRDHKGDASFRSGHFLFNIAFLCNTNRLWDVVTQQLQTAIARQPKRVQVATVFLLRLAGSPRDEEKPGQSGAAAIAGQMAADAFPAGYVRAMPFTGRKTYRAVLNREELAIIGEDAVADLASLEVCDSLPALCDHVDRAIKQASEKHTVALADMRAREEKPQDNTERKLNFHTVQIACDLFALRLVKLADNGADCPLATGSSSGIKHVQRWEDPDATAKTLAERTGREPHEVQTSLCEYNKYVKWWNGAESHKPRHQ